MLPLAVGHEAVQQGFLGDLLVGIGGIGGPEHRGLCVEVFDAQQAAVLVLVQELQAVRR